MEDSIFQMIQEKFDLNHLSYLTAMILAVFGTGLLKSLVKQEFRIQRVWEFARTKIIPFVGTWVIVSFVAVFNPEWQFIEDLVWVAMLAALGQRCLANILALGLPGLKNLPSILTDRS